MGYAAKSYELFKTIIGPNKDRYLSEQTRELLSRFKLFGLIIYDPEKDPLFTKRLQERFNYLSKITGERFLFFAVIKPTGRESFHPFHDPESWYGDQAAEPTEKMSLAAQALCTMLKIPYGETPSIVLTTDFRFNSFLVVNTNIHFIDNQLTILGQLANNFHEIPGNHKLYQILNDLNSNRIEFLNIEYIENEKKHFLEAINQFLTIIKAGQQRSPSTTKSLIRFLGQRLDSLIKHKNKNTENEVLEVSSLLSLLDDKPKDSFKRSLEYPQPSYSYSMADDTEADTFSAKMFKKLASADKYDELSFIEFQELPGLELESKNYFKIAKAFLEHLNNNPELSTINEYSAYSINLCKAFELEINLSIVQWMREHLGIEMPQYFNKVKPVDDPYPFLATGVIPNPRPIYFNRKERSRWVPPGLGESNLCFKSILLSNNTPLPPEVFSKKDQEMFITYWKNINQVRKMVAHSTPVSLSDKDVLENNLRAFTTKGYFTSMINVKNGLRKQNQ